jgi:superfamily I DNA/RNA helicase
VAQALKGGAEGELFLAVDGAQSLYGRPRAFTWKSVGINAVGRSQQLSKNYRNTREILDFAWEVAQAAQPAGADTETHVRVQPTEALRTGPVPAYRACATLAEEQAIIAGLVRRFKSEGIPDRDVAVLYPRKEGTRIESLVQALQRTEEVCWITDSANPILRNRFLATPGVRICTIHSAKGLEFPAVILCGVDQLPSALQGDEAGEANLLYVGLTRAQDRLVLTWTGSSAFTKRVEKSSRARPWNNA